MNTKVKYISVLAVAAFGAATVASAQSAMDAYTLSQTQLRGTARFLSMGGAFGALGGDLSTLNQNPAGIGVYRSSEIGATLDIDFQRSTLQNTGNPQGDYTDTQTRAACNNFGYVGTAALSSSVMPYFQWGVTYNRVNSFERAYRGYFPKLDTSWTNYVASVSGGNAAADLWGNDDYDPFFQSDVPWISALAFNSYLISENPGYNPNEDYPQYLGLYQNGSEANADIQVREKGYVDEYSINLGGNFANMVYWGLGFGITDLSFTRWSYYSEQVSDARVPSEVDPSTQQPLGHTTGAAEWGIENYQQMSGTGFNVKFGLIFKPINELRLGLAVHTPTWYALNFSQSAWTDYDLWWIDRYMVDGQQYADEVHTSNYSGQPYSTDNPYASTGDGYFSRHMKTPWRLMASAAGVIGGRFILSADYVYEAYPSMTFSNDYGEMLDVTNDVKQYYQPSHELRLGAEFRVTPRFSVRAGYNYKSTGAKQTARDGFDYVYTTGTQTLYTFDGDRQNVSCGLGYRFGGFYIDAAYIHSTQTNTWSAFTAFPRSANAEYALDGSAVSGPRAKLRDTRNHLVLTLGYKF